MLTNTEYCVQWWTGARSGWLPFEHGTYATAEAARRAMDNNERLYPYEKFRVAVRNVGDWCEMKQEGEGE